MFRLGIDIVCDPFTLCSRARKDLTSGVMPMSSEDFPSLFWSGETPGKDYDPDNMLHGLFKSYFLVRVCLISGQDLV